MPQAWYMGLLCEVTIKYMDYEQVISMGLMPITRIKFTEICDLLQHLMNLSCKFTCSMHSGQVKIGHSESYAWTVAYHLHVHAYGHFH